MTYYHHSLFTDTLNQDQLNGGQYFLVNCFIEPSQIWKCHKRLSGAPVILYRHNGVCHFYLGSSEGPEELQKHVLG
jgi:hypothetical protein